MIDHDAGTSRSRFLQASNQSFTLSSAALFAGLGWSGLMTVPAVVVSLCGVVLVALGVRLGARLSRHFQPHTFRTAVLVVLGVLGLGLVLRAIDWT